MGWRLTDCGEGRSRYLPSVSECLLGGRQWHPHHWTKASCGRRSLNQTATVRCQVALSAVGLRMSVRGGLIGCRKGCPPPKQTSSHRERRESHQQQGLAPPSL